MQAILLLFLVLSKNITYRIKNGLYFIRGANGSGKSSLLTLLANNFEDCVYSPTIPLKSKESSTGESKFKYILNQIKFSKEKAVLFIDEPYANISDKEKIKNILIEESKKRLVVVTIH